VFTNPGQVFNGIGNAIGQASNFLGGAINSGASTLTSSFSTPTSSSFAFPVGSINYGPIRSQDVTSEFNTFSNNLGAQAAAENRLVFNSFQNRIGEIARTPTTLGLDRLGDLAFAEIGNASRSLGSGLASGIEYATSGFSGSVGNAIAGIGGGLAQLSRTAGNVGAALDLPRTIQSTITDIDQSIQIGREHGFRLGVGNLVGTNQIAQFAVGNDFNGQAVDVNTLSDGILRLSGAAGTGAGIARMLTRSSIVSAGTHIGSIDVPGQAGGAINPGQLTDNCVACAAANLKNKLARSSGRDFATAQDLTRQFGAVGKHVNPVPNSTVAINFFENAGITSTFANHGTNFSNVASPGHFALFGPKHVITGRVLPNGKRVLFDPQLGEVLTPQRATQLLGTPRPEIHQIVPKR